MFGLILAGIMLGAGLAGIMNIDNETENAVAGKSWTAVENIIKTKIGADYYSVGQCTGFVYWCLKNAYGVDMGTNSAVSMLENNLISAGISKVAEGRTGRITSEMKPGDIIIFVKGRTQSHCAILGEGGRLYHATTTGVDASHTLSSWMSLPMADRNCDRYIVYRGLTETIPISCIKRTVSNKTSAVQVFWHQNSHHNINTSYADDVFKNHVSSIGGVFYDD